MPTQNPWPPGMKVHLRPIPSRLDRHREQRDGANTASRPLVAASEVPAQVRATRQMTQRLRVTSPPPRSSRTGLDERRLGGVVYRDSAVMRRSVIVVDAPARLPHEQQPRGHVPRQVRQHQPCVDPPAASHARSSAADPSIRTRRLSCAQPRESLEMDAILLLGPDSHLEVREGPDDRFIQALNPRDRDRPPFRYSPSPGRAMKRSPRSGASTIPSTGSPATTSDNEIVHSGLPLAKLIVPSIGSSTQRPRRRGASPPLLTKERNLRGRLGKRST